MLDRLAEFFCSVGGTAHEELRQFLVSTLQHDAEKERFAFAAESDKNRRRQLHSLLKVCPSSTSSAILKSMLALRHCVYILPWFLTVHG